jgi:hypothetical protein
MSVPATIAAGTWRSARGSVRRGRSRGPRVSRHLALVSAVPEAPRGFQEPSVFVERSAIARTPHGFQEPDVFDEALALLAPTGPVRPAVRMRRKRPSRRGRASVVGLLLSACLGLMGLLSPAGPAVAPVMDRPVVVVQPGDTLWSIALMAAPAVG